MPERDGDGGRPATGTATGDPVERGRLLERVRDAVLSGGTGPASPRDVVSASWRRSLDAHVDPDHGRPRHVFGADELDEVRGSHVLAPALPVLRRTLLDAADEAVHMMIVTDARGHILWREGNTGVLRRADDVALVEGTRWSEDSIGTNAMGTALADGRAVQIHSAEHLVRLYRAWTCAAAPIHDPDTGEVIAAVDLTGPLTTFHPSTLALVRAAAELAEMTLRARLVERDERLRARNEPHLDGLRGEPGALLAPRGRVLTARPDGWLPDRVSIPQDGDRVDLGDRGEGLLEPLAEGWLLRLAPRTTSRPTLALPFLGAERPVARLDGRPVRISLRHAEMLVLLALHPDGLTADQLAQALYGDAGNPVTVRSEVHRLRAALGSSKSSAPSPTGCGPASTPTSSRSAPPCASAASPRPTCCGAAPCCPPPTPPACARSATSSRSACAGRSCVAVTSTPCGRSSRPSPAPRTPSSPSACAACCPTATRAATSSSTARPEPRPSGVSPRRTGCRGRRPGTAGWWSRCCRHRHLPLPAVAVTAMNGECR